MAIRKRLSDKVVLKKDKPASEETKPTMSVEGTPMISSGGRRFGILTEQELNDLRVLFDNVIERFRDPRNWIKNALASKRNGGSASIGDRDAQCFCVIGAFVRGAREKNMPYSGPELMHVIKKAMGLKRHVPDWNDDAKTTHADIMEALALGAENLKLKKSGDTL